MLSFHWYAACLGEVPAYGQPSTPFFAILHGLVGTATDERLNLGYSTAVLNQVSSSRTQMKGVPLSRPRVVH